MSREPVELDDSRPMLKASSAVAGGGRVLVVADGTGIRRFPLGERARLSIGRSEGVDVVVQDGAVSRRHAVIHAGVGSVVEVEDLGSTNGTRVRGAKIASGKRVALHVGDTVEIGHIIVCLAQDTEEDGAEGDADASPEEPAVDPGPLMREVQRLVDRVAPSTINVLLLGETGVGKEVMTERIHRLSPRRDRPLLKINCGAFSEQLIESELFGHERGAFTGASSTKPGLIEQATGGTLMLDEVGELPMPLQVKLLRVLEERSVRRIGGLASHPVDFRIISATNKDLREEAARGAFRSDLYFRLNGITISLPPLRERRDEILPLARKFVRAFVRANKGSVVPQLSAAAEERLQNHAWPGNVRELRNTVERAVLLCEGGVLEVADLVLPNIVVPKAETMSTDMDDEEPPVTVRGAPPSATMPGTHRAASGDHESLNETERRRILEVLEACSGNQTRAAKILGIARGTLITKLNTYGVARPRR